MSSQADRSLPRIDVALDEETRRKVADEQLGMVWNHVTAGAVASTAFAILMAYYLRGSADLLWIQLWIAAKLVVVVPRLACAQIFARRGFPGGDQWREATYWMLAVDGAVWGVGGFYMMGTTIATASLVVASLCCIACVATFGLQAKVGATAAYVVPIIAPMIAGMFLRADAFGIYGGLGLGLFLAQLLISAKGSDSKLAETFWLRMHAADISRERAAALELAERQSAVKSQFLGTVSHELRTPIHGILGVARLVHVESMEPRIRKRMELVESAGTHLLGLVTDLIDVSRIDSGQLRIQEVAFDLSAEVDRIADIYTVRAADKGLTFTLDSSLPSVAWVRGDPVRTRQVLHNLIGNAIKFTDKGWVHLMVRLGDAPEMVLFEVRDTGIGISEADQGVVFDAFTQVGRARSDRKEGTGLGLTIAREIAKLLGGDIALHSKPGFGSIFRFTAKLPATNGPMQIPSDHALPGQAQAAPARVLLAEDNDVNALIAGSMLANDGHDVERVDNGAEAVRRALRETDRPDVVLMDCMMPTMDGLEASRLIRSQEIALGLPRIPIIALSAIVDDDSGKQSFAAGMDDALGKPFSAEQLRKVLQPWLMSGRRGSVTGRASSIGEDRSR